MPAGTTVQLGSICQRHDMRLYWYLLTDWVFAGRAFRTGGAK